MVRHGYPLESLLSGVKEHAPGRPLIQWRRVSIPLLMPRRRTWAVVRVGRSIIRLGSRIGSWERVDTSRTPSTRGAASGRSTSTLDSLQNPRGVVQLEKRDAVLQRIWVEEGMLASIAAVPVIVDEGREVVGIPRGKESIDAERAKARDRRVD